MSVTVTIVAPAEAHEAWERWSDFAEWPHWNPHCVAARLDGPLAAGARLELRLRHPRGQDFYTRPRLSVVTPGQELAWETTSLGLRATTRTRFAPEPDGTRLTIAAESAGVLATMYRMTMTDRTQALIYVGMLDALRDTFAQATGTEPAE